MQGLGANHFPENLRDRILAYALLRTILGLNIAMHGITRLLAGSGHFADSLVTLFHSSILPAFMVRAFGYSLPWVEATVGLLVLFGLWTRYALTAGSLVMVILTFGSALRQDWQTTELQLVYAAVFAALLAFHHWNALSGDGLFIRLRSSH